MGEHEEGPMSVPQQPEGPTPICAVVVALMADGSISLTPVPPDQGPHHIPSFQELRVLAYLWHEEVEANYQATMFQRVWAQMQAHAARRHVGSIVGPGGMPLAG